MTEGTQTQETAQANDALTDAELALVVGGMGTEDSIEKASKATPILL